MVRQSIIVAERGCADLKYRLIDDNCYSPPRQLLFPTGMFHCSASFVTSSVVKFDNHNPLLDPIHLAIFDTI